MALQYDTSIGSETRTVKIKVPGMDGFVTREGYSVTVPYTKEELLAMNQEYVNPTDIAPSRNKYISSLFPHNTNDGYFYGNDGYNKNLINGADISHKDKEDEKDIISYYRNYIIKNYIDNEIVNGETNYTKDTLASQ